MKRRHAMPFGAERDGDGTTRFRLWAPDAESVQLDLVHDHGRVALPMAAGAEGWFSATVPNVSAGARYEYRIDDRMRVPDPASRFQPQDVHAPSAVVDALAFDWPDAGWRGRPWEEAVIYELHVGTFTPEGRFDAIIGRLDYLAELGVTALELMPIADFPGRRGWGYDGVLPFAPEAAYGTPDDLKRLVAAAHERNLMVFLDVVYNHFGPEGNYLHAYAEKFFNPRHATPWGAAVNLDGEGARSVRDFFLHNALYWLEEFHLDGLRLDAVHMLADDSQPDFLSELCTAVRDGPGRERHVHLILENDRNEARYLVRGEQSRPRLATAQWNDDFHHAMHVLLTAEDGNYYADYQEAPLRWLGRALAEGFGYQGEASRHRGGRLRGDASARLPPTAFVNFLQCHDQVGNRAFGERLGHLVPPHRLRLAVTCFLPAPAVPMLFMGEEFNASAPFLFFCDFGPDLAQAVREGRKREFAEFGHGGEGPGIPDANEASTFEACRLDWDEAGRPGHREWLELHHELLALRRRYIVPRLAGMARGGRFDTGGGLRVEWPLYNGEALILLANFSGDDWRPSPAPAGQVIFASTPQADAGHLPPWQAAWLLREPART